MSEHRKPDSLAEVMSVLQVACIPMLMFCVIFVVLADPYPYFAGGTIGVVEAANLQ